MSIGSAAQSTPVQAIKPGVDGAGTDSPCPLFIYARDLGGITIATNPAT